MASASKTPNLNLPQWLETEKPERTDFNAAFDAIDDVLFVVPACRVYNSTDQAVTSGVAKVLSFDTERFDTDNIHDATTSPTRLTCRTAGVYLIIGHMSFTSNPDGNRQLLVKVNDTNFITYVEDDCPPVGTFRPMLTTIYYLNEGDYVELHALQTSGVTLYARYQADFSTEFMMVRIG